VPQKGVCPKGGKTEAEADDKEFHIFDQIKYAKMSNDFWSCLGNQKVNRWMQNLTKNNA